MGEWGGAGIFLEAFSFQEDDGLRAHPLIEASLGN